MPALVAGCRDSAGPAFGSRFGYSGRMGPGRRGGRLSSNRGIARGAGGRGGMRGGWLRCRLVGRLHLASAGWGPRGLDGLVRTLGLLPARLLGWCRGRVGGGVSVASTQLPVTSTQLPVTSSDRECVHGTPCGAGGAACG